LPSTPSPYTTLFRSAAKRNPKPAGPLLVIVGGNVKRCLFAERQSVKNFLAICRQGLCVSRAVRPRMINHRVLLEINQRDKKGKTQRDHNESANDNSLQLVAGRVGSMHLKARTPSRQHRANRFLWRSNRFYRSLEFFYCQ